MGELEIGLRILAKGCWEPEQMAGCLHKKAQLMMERAGIDGMHFLPFYSIYLLDRGYPIYAAQQQEHGT